MNQTGRRDFIATPITDGFYKRELAEGRVGWTHAQYEFAANFERNQRRLIAALNTADATLTPLLPCLSGQYAVNMRELISHIRATLARVQ
jgi:hypothetical protein